MTSVQIPQDVLSIIESLYVKSTELDLPNLDFWHDLHLKTKARDCEIRTVFESFTDKHATNLLLIREFAYK